MDSVIFDRKYGMLWGLVVGDCLGSPLQFTGDDRPYVTEMEPCAYFNTPAGYWTDDSAMAFCVMESAVRCGGYDLKDIANNFVRWYDNGFWSSLPYAFDIGAATADAIVNGISEGSLKNGYENSQGNGSIMRLAPSVLLNGDAADNRILHEISDLTHNSAAVRNVVDIMAEICRGHIAGCRTGRRSEYRCREDVDNSGWVVSTLQAALWAFNSTGTFEEGMLNAVNLGGDADSIGAVYGQIAGAYYGCHAIPERWISAVKDRNKIDDLFTAFLKITG